MKKGVIINLISLLIIIVGYAVFIYTTYWSVPVTSDGLAYCYQSALPGKSTYLFERYVNFYIGKFFTSIFFSDNLLEGFAFLSLLYHLGIIFFAYLIGLKLAGKIQGIMAAIFTALFPVFFVWTTEFFSDSVCLFFGLAALFFSFKGDRPAGSLKCFLCGLSLAAAIFSKSFGFVFIVPVFINLLYSRPSKKFFLFGAGILVVFLFLAICDYIFIKDFFYHLNPNNYLKYVNLIFTKLRQTTRPDLGRSIMADLLDRHFIVYFIFFILFLLLSPRFIESRERFDWKRVGAFSIALVGLISALNLLRSSFYYPGVWMHPQYVDCMYVPWIIAFCSSLGFAKNKDGDSGYDWITNIICVFLSILFVIVIFLTRNISEYYDGGQSSLGRFIHLGFLWMLIFSLVIVVHVGNYLAKNGFNKIYAALFILGCAGIIFYSATYSNIYSYNTGRMKLSEKTKTFIEKYRKVSQEYNVIPFDCNVSRSFEIRTTLLLSKLEDGLGLEYFFAKEDIKKITDNNKIPFYLFTRLNPEILKQNLEPMGLQSIPDTGYDFFDCKFYLIDRIKQK